VTDIIDTRELLATLNRIKLTQGRGQRQTGTFYKFLTFVDDYTKMGSVH